MLNNTLLDLDILQLFQLYNIHDFRLQMIHQCTYILVWTKLAPISDSYPTKRTLLFALSVVSFNTLTAKPMQTRLVNNWVVDHILADRTSQILHDSSDKFYPDLVVYDKRLWHTEFVALLIVFVIENYPFQVLLFFLIMVR